MEHVVLRIESREWVTYDDPIEKALDGDNIIETLDKVIINTQTWRI